MSQRATPTFVGRVASVSGGVVTVRLEGPPTTLVLVRGESHRIGQIGAFMRIPLGYTNLFGVCTQIGADAAPPALPDSPDRVFVDPEDERENYRWLTISLFGETVGGHFDRGVGQYPTVADEVHLVTSDDLDQIYAERGGEDFLDIGTIASSSGHRGRLQLSNLVSRHCSVIGSTGAGKSNLVAVLLEQLTSGRLPSARTLVIDAHGEYVSMDGPGARIIHTGASIPEAARSLRVPFWALPFGELFDLVMGDMQPHHAEFIRDRVADMKRKAATKLPDPPAPESITADSPVPFSMRQLWFDLETIVNATYKSNAPEQLPDDRTDPEEPGSAAELRPPRYPRPAIGSGAPYKDRSGLSIRKQLDLLHSRLRDARFGFMFDPDDPLHPDLDGEVKADLSDVLVEWIGGPEPVTVLDVSGLPPEVLGTVVGTMLRLVYDALFWAMELPVGGREQPLLIVLEEAHRFLPATGDTPAHRVLSRIAKEGRKYGVGLLVVTQRPSDVDASVLSQCGTMVALRVTNGKDRGAVTSLVPDDLGGLTELLPSLRTGEALVLGDALQVPSRVRVSRAAHKPIGDDPDLPAAWLRDTRPKPEGYKAAVKNWRAQSTSAAQREEAEATSPAREEVMAAAANSPEHNPEEGKPSA